MNKNIIARKAIRSHGESYGGSTRITFRVFYFMEKILCYKKHQVDVIFENEFYSGGICIECNYQVITHSLKDECDHDVRTIGINKRNNTIEIRDICIKCFHKIKVYKKTDFILNELSNIPIRNIDIIDKQKEIFYENRRIKYSEINDLLNKKRDEIIIEVYSERDKIRNEYYKTDEWKKLRLLVLNRDKYICQGCLKNQATEVHHQSYLHFKKEFMFELISLCNHCHSRYHNKL
jgi:hypothetical protein